MERVLVFQAGERFATMGEDGVVRIWQVTEYGLIEMSEGPYEHELPHTGS
jgi:hypothetical protein